MQMDALQVDVRLQHPVVHRLVRLRQAEHELLHHKLALHGPLEGAPSWTHCTESRVVHSAGSQRVVCCSLP